MRKFTYFVGNYRQFVKDFSKIAKSLTEMHPNTTIKNGKNVKTVKPFVWGKTQQEAFDQLKKLLSSPHFFAMLIMADHLNSIQILARMD